MKKLRMQGAAHVAALSCGQRGLGRPGGVEIDIIGCTMMASGAIGGRERVGTRVRP